MGDSTGAGSNPAPVFLSAGRGRGARQQHDGVESSRDADGGAESLSRDPRDRLRDRTRRADALPEDFRLEVGIPDALDHREPGRRQRPPGGSEREIAEVRRPRSGLLELEKRLESAEPGECARAGVQKAGHGDLYHHELEAGAACADDASQARLEPVGREVLDHVEQAEDTRLEGKP
jgi:hypothetical protein